MPETEACPECAEACCSPDVCRHDCHPRPVGWKAKLRKASGFPARRPR